jgi:hypothetical protein
MKPAAARLPAIIVPIVAIVLTACTGVARANDRPFQFARTAVLEDDENVWSVESWVQRYGGVRGLSLESEYTFGGGTSLQFELTRFVDRHDERTGHEAELEFKQLFNNIARDGYGWGVSVRLSAERTLAKTDENTHENTRERGGTVPTFGVQLPFSIALGDGGGYLHLDVGVGKTRDERRAWSSGIGIERELLKRTTFFAELAREGDMKFAQIGARHWLRRDRFAIDFSVQQQRVDGRRDAGFILGLGWYDL